MLPSDVRRNLAKTAAAADPRAKSAPPMPLPLLSAEESHNEEESSGGGGGLITATMLQSPTPAGSAAAKEGRRVRLREEADVYRVEDISGARDGSPPSPMTPQLQPPPTIAAAPVDSEKKKSIVKKLML